MKYLLLLLYFGVFSNLASEGIKCYRIYIMCIYDLDTFCDIVFLNETNVTEVSVGSLVAFQCTCNDSEWELNGYSITEDWGSRYIINTNSSTLTILAVRSSDSGNYTCGDDNLTLLIKGTKPFKFDYFFMTLRYIC